MKLEAIRALIEAATPGPWFATVNTFYLDDEERQDVQERDTWTVGPNADDINWQNDSNYRGYGMWKRDADLVAASRTLLPKLLAVAMAAEHVIKDAEQIWMLRVALKDLAGEI